MLPKTSADPSWLSWVIEQAIRTEAFLEHPGHPRKAFRDA